MKRKLISLLFKIYTKLADGQESDKPTHHPRFYFKIDFSSFPPSIKIQNHEGFVEEKTKVLNELSGERSYKSYIEEVFQVIKDCDFVIFQSPKLEFIQYWIGNGVYWLDFPMVEYNGNKSNLTKLTSLLKKLEFKEWKKEGTKLKCYNYCLSKTPEYFLLNANLGKDKDLVINFTSEVLKKIFNVSLEKLEITVG